MAEHFAAIVADGAVVLARRRQELGSQLDLRVVAIVETRREFRAVDNWRIAFHSIPDMF